MLHLQTHVQTNLFDKRSSSRVADSCLGAALHYSWSLDYSKENGRLKISLICKLNLLN